MIYRKGFLLVGFIKKNKNSLLCFVDTYLDNICQQQVFVKHGLYILYCYKMCNTRFEMISK